MGGGHEEHGLYRKSEWAVCLTFFSSLSASSDAGVWAKDGMRRVKWSGAQHWSDGRTKGGAEPKRREPLSWLALRLIPISPEPREGIEPAG